MYRIELGQASSLRPSVCVWHHSYPLQVLLLLFVRDEEERRRVRVGFPAATTLYVTRHGELSRSKDYSSSADPETPTIFHILQGVQR